MWIVAYMWIVTVHIFFLSLTFWQRGIQASNFHHRKFMVTPTLSLSLSYFDWFEKNKNSKTENWTYSIASKSAWMTSLLTRKKAGKTKKIALDNILEIWTASTLDK